MMLYNQIKRNLEHVGDFFQSCDCSFSPSSFQVGNVTLPDISLVRDVELRFTDYQADLVRLVILGATSRLALDLTTYRFFSVALMVRNSDAAYSARATASTPALSRLRSEKADGHPPFQA
jgi:hypothetical protein